MRRAAQSAGVTLAGTVIEPVLPVQADPERIALVLANLLGNAIRYAPPQTTV